MFALLEDRLLVWQMACNDGLQAHVECNFMCDIRCTAARVGTGLNINTAASVHTGFRTNTV